MKKLLSLIGALTMGATSSLSVIACGPKDTGETKPTPPTNPATENIKQWSQQTSNIAKSLILSQEGNYSTSRLLDNALKSTDNNILNLTDKNTGSNYDTFKELWGYNGKIEGFTADQFRGDKDDTVDWGYLSTASSINTTLGLVNTLVLPILTNPNINNSSISGLINGLAKDFILDAMWDLNQNPEMLITIKSILPSIGELINNFNAFDAKTELGKDYVENDIAKSVLGENNNDGWLGHYETKTGFKSEAITKESSILKAENFTDWNQVALLKSSVNLNGLISKMSDGKTTLGKLFDDSIVYQGNVASDFDLEKFAADFQAIVSLTPENIIELISNLIPLVKLQFGITPTTALTEITTKQPTNAEKGILNIVDVIETVEKIILTKDGFTNFISDIFFKSETSFALKNYITLDLTCKNNQSLSETITPIKPKIVDKLGNLYTTSIEPIMQKFVVQDIATEIKAVFAKLTEKNGFAIEINKLGELVSIFTDIDPFLEKITSYQSKEALSADWSNLWSLLGLQDASQEDFIEDSVLAHYQQFVKDNQDFLTSLKNLLKQVPNVIKAVFDTLANKSTIVNLDFTNEKLWQIDETTIGYNYDESKQETTITYTLVDKTTNKTYKVVIVVDGNADSELTEARQVWLQSLTTA